MLFLFTLFWYNKSIEKTKTADKAGEKEMKTYKLTKSKIKKARAHARSIQKKNGNHVSIYFDSIKNEMHFYEDDCLELYPMDNCKRYIYISMYEEY